MIRRISCIISIVVLILGFSPQSVAAMGSNHFEIQVSVFSGGGSMITSTSYKQNSAMSLPSPLADGNDPPFSNWYDLYPGFWHTTEPILKQISAMPWIPLLLLED